MNNLLKVSLALCLLVSFSCSGEKKENSNWAENAVKVSSVQLKQLAETCASSGKLPRSVKDDQVRLEDLYDWTSGFFPGSLWYQYELTGDDYFKQEAEKYTSLLYKLQEYTGTHDLGFMVFCSYGNQYRLTKNDTLPKIIVNAANSLSTRYNPEVKAIRSWDFGSWNYPVIIDNMMNLDMLYWASKHTGDPKYKNIAIEHTNTTLKHHFRDDMSSYHVISYNNDGTVESKGTFQGFADDSDWARGQAWALYGMVVGYREVKDEAYLKAAQDIAKLIMELPTMPADKIPYWDYNAPDIPNAPRDVSAAAVTASALFELSTMVSDGTSYFNYAEEVLKNLSAAPYLAKEGTNHGFILEHAVGHLPANSEIDTPLNYADYYYLESLKRYFDLKKVELPLKNIK